MTSKFREPRSKEVNARALTDPKPAYVSIVQAGANQAPFRSVKMVDVLSAEEAGDMVEKLKAMQVDGYEVARIRFAKGEVFPDEAAVKAWLEDGGYSDHAVKEVDDGFEIENEADKFEGDVVEIETDGGTALTIWVGKLAEGEAPTSRGVVTDVEVIGKKEDGDGDGRETGGGPAKKTKTKAHAKRKVTSARSSTLDPPLFASEEEDDEEDETSEKDEASAKDESEVAKTVISYNAAHSDGTPAAARGAAWDAGAEKRKADVDDLLVMSAWRSPGPKADLKKGDFKFPHHKAAGQHAVVFRGVTAGIAAINGGRGGTTIPQNERRGVYNHLAKHVRDDFEAEPAPFRGQAEYEVDVQVSRAVFDATKTKRAYVSDDEVAQKFDEFMAHFSESLTLGGVVSDAKDGIPGGFGEAVQAMVVAMRNNIIADNIDGVKAVAAEFGELVAALANAFAGAGEDTERAQKTFDLFQTNITELTGPAAGPAEEDEPAPEEDEVTEKEGGDGEDAETSEKEGADAVTEALAPVMTAISDLVAKVDANQKSTEETLAETNTKIAEVQETTKAMEDGLSKRVKELEAERQTRKSADGEDDGSPTIKKNSLGEITLRGQLGISDTSKSGGY